MADAAEISTTRGYRDLPNQRALILAAIPAADRASVLPSDAPTDDVAVRVDFVTRKQAPIVARRGATLRAALKMSLEDRSLKRISAAIVSQPEQLAQRGYFAAWLTCETAVEGRPWGQFRRHDGSVAPADR